MLRTAEDVMQRWWMTAAVVAAACGEPSQTSAILDLTGDAAAGATVYSTICATCHGVNGEGLELFATPPLVSTTKTDEEIVEVILTGNDLGMASAADYLLSDQDVADVLAYIRDGLGQ
jgi:mono/diheme cytochrome c family protein